MILCIFKALVSKNTSETRTVLENLQFSTDYVVGVSAVNAEGRGTLSVHSVRTGTDELEGEGDRERVKCMYIYQVLYECIQYMYYGETRFPKELTIFGFPSNLKVG